MADGGPGFVDVLRASLGGDRLAVTVTGLSAGRSRGGPAAGRHGVPRERPGVRAAPHNAGERDPEPHHVVRRGPAHRRRGAGAHRVVVGWAARPPTTAERGCWPRWAPPRTHRCRSGAASSLAARLAGGAGPGGVRSGRGDRRGQPAARPARRDQRLRAPEGCCPRDGSAVDATLERLAAATDKKLALARGRCRRRPGLRPAAAREPSGAGVGLVAGAVGFPERARRADLVVTGEGVRPSPPVQQGPLRRGPGGRVAQSAPASRWPVESWSGPERCGPSG